MISLLLLWGCQLPKTTPPTTAALVGGQIVIAHTNDLHAHFEGARADWIDGSPVIGGLAEVGKQVAALHAEKGDDHVLYLDGGDVLTGTPLMEFEVRGAMGGAMLGLMEDAGMDAWVLGNHEFDLGYDNIATMVAASNVTVLSANLDALDGSGAPAIPGLQDHMIFERGGLKIGVFGLTTDSLARLTGTDAVDRMTVVDVVESARQQVAILEPQVDLVVALTHIGLKVDQRIAEEVPGVDLIVGGHSHTPLSKAVQVGDTWIVQAGCYARQLGVVELTVADGRISTFSSELRDLIPGSTPLTGPTADGVQTWHDAIETMFAENVSLVQGGNLGRSKHGETTLGRWASDMVKIQGEGDIGIYNPGGLRADLIEGVLTRGDLYQVFPFKNELVRFKMTGLELVGLLIRTADGTLGKNRSVMQFAGLTARWQVKHDVPELVEVRINGSLLRPEDTYTAVTNSYVADRWEYNLGFEPRNIEVLDLVVFDAAVNEARKGPIVPPPNPRMIRIDEH
jgi:5'-nucleotidase/UDP-sugar diphosphatase